MPTLRRLLLAACLLLPASAQAADYRVDLIVTLNRNAPPDVAMTHGRPAPPLTSATAPGCSAPA
jgi:hypothetical protein